MLFKFFVLTSRAPNRAPDEVCGCGIVIILLPNVHRIDSVSMLILFLFVSCSTLSPNQSLTLCIK